jgi:phasin family protein
VAAEQAPAVAEAAAEQVAETRKTVQEAVAETAETVADTTETLGAGTAAATQDLTATVADTATVAIEKTADIADQAGDAVETSIAAAAEAAVETQDAAHAAYAQQETTIMNDTIQNTTEKSQAFIADANERAKGALEKGTKFFQEITEFGKGNVEAVVESSKIAARGLETMGQDTAAYLKSSFEDASQALRTLSTIKSPTELLKFQSDYVRSAFDALVAQTSRGTEASLKLAGEVAQPISNRVAVAAEKIKVSA